MTMNEHLLAYERAGRITASVVGAILRTDPYHSRKWAFRVITGLEPERDPGPDAQRGLDHEADALQVAEVELGLFVQPGMFVPHKTLPWLGGSPDGFLYDRELQCKIPVECKCPRAIYPEIPPHYYDQVQTQIEICDVPYGYFIQWVNDTQVVQVVQRDTEWWERTRPQLEEFHRLYVATGTEPPRSPRRGKNANSSTSEVV